MQFSVSHVLFQKWLGPFPSIIICLRYTFCYQSEYYVRFHALHAPTKIWVASLRGLPRSTLFCFQKDSVTVALSSLIWHIQRLSHFDCRNGNFSSLGLMDSPSTNTTGITASAMDFPHENLKLFTRLSKICTHSLVNYKSWLSKICLPNTSFSRRFKRFKISKFVIEVEAVTSNRESGWVGLPVVLWDDPSFKSAISWRRDLTKAA